MTVIVSEIIATIDTPAFDLATAEGRAGLDKFLRDRLAQISDESTRAHAGELIKQYRMELYWQADQVFRGRHRMTGPHYGDRSVEIKTLRRPKYPWQKHD